MLKTVRPKLPTKARVPSKAAPRTANCSIVGGAFDYLLRFEIQRRAPHAKDRPWNASQVPDMICRDLPGGSTIGVDFMRNAPPELHIDPFEAREYARNVLDEAKKVVAAYVASNAPEPNMQADLAAHSIRLAYLDPVVRAHHLSHRFREVDSADVQDLLKLLSIVPFDSLIHDKVMLLNPTFGASSRLVGGADADLISGDTLLEIKATQRDEFNLAQLVGYFILSRNERLTDPSFPEIKHIGTYFSRYGYVRLLEVELWTSNPKFAGFESWFIEHAKKSFPPRSSASHGCTV